MSSNYYIDKQEFENEIINFQAKLREHHLSIGLTEEDANDIDRYRAWKKSLKSDIDKYGLHFCSNKLAKMLLDLSKNNLKSGKYHKIQYDDKEDINGQVVFEMLKVLDSYDPDYFSFQDNKQPNSFGYYTQSTQRCISKQLCKENEKKARQSDILLFLDDMAIDFGNDDDNDNFKSNAKSTRDYVNSLDGNDLLYYSKTKSKLPKQSLKRENVESLRSLVLGINQYANPLDL